MIETKGIELSMKEGSNTSKMIWGWKWKNPEVYLYHNGETEKEVMDSVYIPVLRRYLSDTIPWETVHMGLKREIGAEAHIS